MATLSQAYGITSTRDTKNQPLAKLHITEPHLNWYGSAYGGCFVLLASTVTQETVGAGLFGCNYNFKFLKKVQLHETMVGQAEQIKIGRTNTSTITRIYKKDTLVGTMYADYFKPSDQIPFDCVSSSFPVKRPSSDFVLNTKESPSTPRKGQAFQEMFCAPPQKETAEKKDLHGRASVGIYTDELFTDVNGCIDPALLGFLADDAVGVACWSELGSCVTTSLSMSILTRIKPGAFVSCNAEITLKTGSLMLAQGTLWADDTMVGTCSGTFMRT